MGFIYKVTNKINGKIYIGQTSGITPEERFKQHVKEAKVKQYNRPFHLAINKYGAENFIVEKIEEVSSEILSEREKYWIKYYHSYIHDENANGYNTTMGGEGTIKYDYAKLAQEYEQTKSLAQAAKNCSCGISTIRRAREFYNLPQYNRSEGVAVVAYNDKEELTFNSIKQAAEYLALSLNKNSQTIRKRITAILLHKPNQLGYGYYWKEL